MTRTTEKALKKKYQSSCSVNPSIPPTSRQRLAKSTPPSSNNCFACTMADCCRSVVNPPGWVLSYWMISTHRKNRSSLPRAANFSRKARIWSRCSEPTWALSALLLSSSPTCQINQPSASVLTRTAVRNSSSFTASPLRLLRVVGSTSSCAVIMPS